MRQQCVVFIESNTTGSGIEIIKKTQELELVPIVLARNPKLYPEIMMLCQVVLCETNCWDTLEKQLLTLQQHYELLGVMSTSEYYMETVSKVCAQFNLPSNPVATINVCRHKYQLRQLLAHHGFPQPDFFIANNIEDFESQLDGIKFPLVIKPVSESGSLNVKLCTSKEEATALAMMILEKRINIRHQKVDNAVLCESFIAGQEYSIETFADGAEIKCIGITEKKVSGAPYFVETGHIFPADLDGDTQKLIEETVVKALKLVGNRFGAMHTEIKLDQGRVYIIEINPRLAGGMIPQILKHATGIDLLENWLLATCNLPLDLQPKQKKISQITFITSAKSGIFKGIEFHDGLKEFEKKVIYQIGKEVKIPTSFYDRLGYVISTATSYEEIANQIEKIASGVRVTIA